jgi:hypothetical protein
MEPSQIVMNKKRDTLLRFIIIAVLAITGSCKDDDDEIAAPEITAFTPDSDVPGSHVTINGKNFSDHPEKNSVAFNGAAATITLASSTQLVVITPANVTTGKITVTVNGRTATSATDYIVLPSPTITGFSPSIGAPGVSIVITGENFLTTAASNIVKFNGKVATVTNATETSLTVTVPAEATTGKITVSIGSGTVTSTDDFEICTGATELLITNVVITGISAQSVTTTYDIVNVGSEPLDLTKWILQTYLSTDGTMNTATPSGGYQLNDGGTLQTGQHFSTGWSPNTSGSLSTYPYMILTARLKHGETVTECNTDNNDVIKLIE